MIKSGDGHPSGMTARPQAERASSLHHRPARSWRWSSSQSAQLRSYHLLLCRGGATHLPLPGPLSVATYSELLEFLPLDPTGGSLRRRMLG